MTTVYIRMCVSILSYHGLVLTDAADSETQGARAVRLAVLYPALVRVQADTCNARRNRVSISILYCRYVVLQQLTVTGRFAVVRIRKNVFKCTKRIHYPFCESRRTGTLRSPAPGRSSTLRTANSKT